MFLAVACWSFASPLFVAPDEPAHTIYAAALVHGHVGMASNGPNKAEVAVTVPAWVSAAYTYSVCVHFKIEVPATCLTSLTNASNEVAQSTYVGRYPPLYYALVGWPSLFFHGSGAAYAMRLMSGLLTSVMIGLTGFAIAAWSKRRAIVTGVAVALTPLVFFLGSSVSPSGFEISSAICLWTLFTIWVVEYADDVPSGLLWTLSGVASTFVLIRGLSSFYFAIIAVLCVAILTRQQIAVLLRRTAVRVSAALVASAGLLAVGWVIAHQSLDLSPAGVPVSPSASFQSILWLSAKRIPKWNEQTIGVFGWLDTYLPKWFYLLWYILVIVLFLIAMLTATMRQRLVLAATTIISFALPVVLVAKQAHKLGLVGQGRDHMPLTVGIAILSGALAAEWIGAHARRRDMAALFLLAVALLDGFAFSFNLKRYVVGEAGRTLYFLHPKWYPPVAPVLLLGLEAVSVVGLLVLGVVAVRRSTPAGTAVTP